MTAPSRSVVSMSSPSAAQDGRQPAREVPGALLVAALDVGRQVHVARRLLVELQADQARDAAEFLLRVGRAQQLLQGRQHGAQVLERVGAEGALAPFLGPVRGLELGLVGPVDARHLLRAVGEAHALVFLDRPAVVEIVALEARHAVDRHAGADEAQARDCRATRRCGRASRAASPPTPHAARRRSPCRARSSAAADSAPRPCCRSRAGSRSSRRPAHWNDSDRARRPARRARPARPSFCRPGRNFSRCWRRKWRKTYSRAVSSPRRVTRPSTSAVISAL